MKASSRTNSGNAIHSPQKKSRGALQVLYNRVCMYCVGLSHPLYLLMHRVRTMTK